jgi:signal peptidase I
LAIQNETSGGLITSNLKGESRYNEKTRMTKHGDEETGGGGSGSDSTPHFDPLFSPWEKSPEPAKPFDFDDADGSAGAFLHPAAGRPADRVEDSLWWEAPAASSRYTAQRMPAWYPDRPATSAVGGATDLQRRLQQETITLPRPERRWLVTFREVAETLLLAALIFLAVRGSFQNFKVEGHSMDPSLADGEYLIVNKLTYAQIDLSFLNFLPFFDAGDDPAHYLWGGPDRGDVIVFRAPTSPDRDFIKRIIGVPGDTVTIDQTSGQVSVNGSPLAETYILGTTTCSSTCEWKVPEANTPESQAECGSNDCYFVLGDNRQNSSDSRQNWLVPKENIVGKALITYWHEGSPEIHFAPNHSVGITDEASAEN